MHDKIALIKCLQTGQETDFILVSCTGSGIEPNRREQVIKAKKVCHSPLLYFLVDYICLHETKTLQFCEGWGRFIEKIRLRVHNYPPWSINGIFTTKLISYVFYIHT